MEPSKKGKLAGEDKVCNEEWLKNCIVSCLQAKN